MILTHKKRLNHRAKKVCVLVILKNDLPPKYSKKNLPHFKILFIKGFARKLTIENYPICRWGLRKGGIQ